MKFVFTLLLFILAGCSRLDIGVRWADTLVMSKVNDYFDLTSAEDREVREEFNRAFAEFRHNDFPLFAQSLREAAQAIEDSKMNEARYDAIDAQFVKIWKTGMARFEKMGQMVIDRQVKSEFKTFDEEFQKKYDKELKIANDRDKRVKEDRKSFDRLVDESVEFLTEEQEKDVDTWIYARAEFAPLRVETRRYVFENFKKVRRQENERRAFVTKFFTDWESLQTPEYQKERAASKLEWKKQLLKLANTLNEKQKKNLIANFRRRAEELQKLAKD